jgi:hypothetical protein
VRFVLGPASISIMAHDAGHPKVPVIALWMQPLIGLAVHSLQKVSFC